MKKQNETPGKWTAEDYLNSLYSMACLQHLAEYEKETLLELIRSGRILDHLREIGLRTWDLQEEMNQDENLAPGGAEEIAMDAATWNGDPWHEPSQWTKAEIKVVNHWWEKTFRDEPNPLYLDTEDDEF